MTYHYVYVNVYIVDVVLFCALTELQLQLYRALLRSRAVMSCLRSADPAQHLRCISALKKLCNHAQLLHAVSMETNTVCDNPEVFCFNSCINSNFGLRKLNRHRQLYLTVLQLGSVH